MKHIYHGTTQKGLNIIKPFKRFTPGGESVADNIPPRIYATYKPAFAIAYSFPWSSEDGIDIVIKNNTITIIVPKERRKVLEQEVCLYTLPDNTFIHTDEEETGLTYHSTTELIPLDSQCFENVEEAMEKIGGKIRFI